MSEKDDYGEKEYPPLLEPYNLAPLIVFLVVGMGIALVGIVASWWHP